MSKVCIDKFFTELFFLLQKRSTMLAIKKNYKAASVLRQDDLHEERSKVLSDFRADATKILIATNGFVSAIESSQLRAMVIFDLPCFTTINQPNVYESAVFLRNIGRVGRESQKKSIVFNLFGSAEANIIEAWKTTFGIQFSETIDARNHVN